MSKETVREKFMLSLKGKNYLPVAARIVEFRQAHPDYCIDTVYEEIGIEKTLKGETTIVAIPHMRAFIRDDKGKLLSTGVKRVSSRSGPVGNFPVEAAETGAIGRALGALGYGTLEVYADDEDGPCESPV